MLGKLGEARTVDGQPVFNLTEEMRRELADLFDHSRKTSKMEQLYATLFAIQLHSPLAHR